MEALIEYQKIENCIRNDSLQIQKATELLSAEDSQVLIDMRAFTSKAASLHKAEIAFLITCDFESFTFSEINERYKAFNKNRNEIIQHWLKESDQWEAIAKTVSTRDSRYVDTVVELSCNLTKRVLLEHQSSSFFRDLYYLLMSKDVLPDDANKKEDIEKLFASLFKL